MTNLAIHLWVDPSWDVLTLQMSFMNFKMPRDQPVKWKSFIPLLCPKPVFLCLFLLDDKGFAV